jgi:hypothetical protein
MLPVSLFDHRARWAWKPGASTTKKARSNDGVELNAVLGRRPWRKKKEEVRMS